MNLLGASLKARETEIIPNVFPLDPEPKEQDMQEKKAATEGEEAMMIHKLLENQKMLFAALNQLPKKTPVRTAKLFTEMTGKCSGQLEHDLFRPKGGPSPIFSAKNRKCKDSGQKGADH